MIHRELTCSEKSTIKKLVKELCANYNHEYGCLLLNGNCYMMYGVGYTNTGMCKYFRESVLPTNPMLEAVLTGGSIVETHHCIMCDGVFPANGKKVYCSDVCAAEKKKRQQREYIRKRRSKC
jgi:predicted nucleic acid-binding Zn ribbon protein